MKIGSQAGKLTSISASNPDTIVVRGHDLCADLIGKVSFTDHAWLLVTGKLPTPGQRRVLDAALVAIAEHGLVPSVTAARMTSLTTKYWPYSSDGSRPISPSPSAMPATRK
jgi:citrate synthase